MKKVFVSPDFSNVRTLSPFAYKDPIKTLDKSNEARVTLDGVRVFRSAVTSGRDVKSGSGALKFHLYFYSSKEAAEARDTSKREFFPISAEEFRAYKDDPAYVIELVSANVAVPPAPAPAPEPTPAPELPADLPAELVEAALAPEPAPEPAPAESYAGPDRRATRKAKRK
jgi:hypothetical protein